MISLFLSLLPSHTPPTAVALGNAWLLFFLLLFLPHLFFTRFSSLCLFIPSLSSLIFFFFFTNTESVSHPFPLSWPNSSSDCYDCCAFLCHGLQEEWVSTCQRAQVCTVDTGWLVRRLLERGGRCLHARAAERKLQISHKVTMQGRARRNIDPDEVKCTKIYLNKHHLFVYETVSMMQIYYRAGSLVG